MINSNPETVSTDYDMCDRLYFDDISFEVVMDIYLLENPLGIILSMGGQLPNNIAKDLHTQKARILGTSADSIDNAENRFKFSRMLDNMTSTKISQPEWKELTDMDAAKAFCAKVGYPCIIRPSYVLSGAAMNVATSPHDLETFLKQAVAVSKDCPVVISKFVTEAKEIDVDAVARNGELICMAVSEHVENAGVHSGDATLVTPPDDLNQETITRIREICQAIGEELAVNGPYNIQLIAKNNELKVIECNLRVSRSFPFVSKTLNYDFVAAATRVILGEKVEPVDVYRGNGDVPLKYGVKVAQFSFSRLAGADFALGVEMASTGEVACFGEGRHEAYLKALMSTGFKLPKREGLILLSIGSYKHKLELEPSVRQLHKMNYKLFGSAGTADFYRSQDIPVRTIEWPFEEVGVDGTTKGELQSMADFLAEKEFDLVINLPMHSGGARRVSTHGYRTRRFAVDYAIPLIADVKCAKLFVEALRIVGRPPVKTHIDCLTSQRIVRLPGLIDVHVHLRDPGQTHKEDFDSGTSSALAGGITLVCAMPNTDPAVTDLKILNEVRETASRKARCDYGLFVAATASNSDEWKNITLDQAPIALKMYLNQTFSQEGLKNMKDWRAHLESFPKWLPICAHAEGLTMAALILVASLLKRPIHICHVASEEEIMIIKEAKAKGIQVTCEVAPHHLFLDESDAASIGGFGMSQVRPALKLARDQKALWDNLNVVDCFASDHAPHTRAEKEEGKPGFPGLETTLPLLLDAVNEGRLTLNDIITRMHTNPKKIFNIPDQNNTYVEVDLDEVWTLGVGAMHSKAQWTPFAGKKVQGKVRRVVLRGELAFVDDQILVQPGFGKEVHPDVKIPSKVIDEENLLQTEEVFRKREASMSSTNMRKIEVDVSRGEASESGLPHKKVQEMKSPVKSLDSLMREEGMSPNISSRQSAIEELKGSHIMTVLQFKRDSLHSLYNLAQTLKRDVLHERPIDYLRGKVMGSLFFEASTRTSCSFAAAMMRLGGHVVSFNTTTSSMTKGETTEDTVSTVAAYSDLLVIRHSHPGHVMELASLPSVSGKPVINAGDGIGEHPTQALLDVFTIREEIGTVNKLIVSFPPFSAHYLTNLY